MIVWPLAERPVEFAVAVGDRLLVDAGDAPFHQAVGVKFPVLVAIGTKPIPAVVVILIGKAYRYAVACMRPNFLDEAIVELA
jgi:hypothetical protein